MVPRDVPVTTTKLDARVPVYSPHMPLLLDRSRPPVVKLALRVDQDEGMPPLSRLLDSLMLVNLVSRLQLEGRGPEMLLWLRSRLVRLVTYPRALGRVPTSPAVSRSTDTGSPPEQVTPPHTVGVHGSADAELHPLRPADVQLADVIAWRTAYKDTPALGGGGLGGGGAGGGGGGLGHDEPMEVLVYVTDTVPLNRPGRLPHRAVLLLSSRRVMPVMPDAQELGTVEVSWFVDRDNRARLASVLHAEGN